MRGLLRKPPGTISAWRSSRRLAEGINAACGRVPSVPERGPTRAAGFLLPNAAIKAARKLSAIFG